MKREHEEDGGEGVGQSKRARLEPGGSVSSPNEYDDTMERAPIRPKEEEVIEQKAERETPSAKDGAAPEKTDVTKEEDKEVKAESESEDGDNEVQIVEMETKNSRNSDPQEEVTKEEPSAKVKEAVLLLPKTSVPKESKGEDDPSKQPEIKLSYPKPKNFAERMMNALERGIAPNAVWWVGNGKAVGLHPKNLKACPELTEYFKAKDYSGFIRNCNRWGFRRVAHHKVDPGIVTYQNSLFQKGQPHLVKHMRMDSDVQDVFARHQNTSAGPTGESDAEKATRIIAEARALKGPSRIGRKSRGGVEPSPVPIAANNGQPAAAGGVSTDVAAAALAALAASSGQNPSDEATLSKEFMLRKILQLTDQFLNHPGTLYSDDGAFKTTTSLLRALGQQHEADLQTRGHLPTLLRLEASLKPAGAATAPAPVYQPPAPAPAPPVLPAAPPGMDPLQALLLKAQVQQQLQQQQQQQAQQQAQQQQQQAQQQQQQSPAAANAATLIQTLLAQSGLQQQQQQQPKAHPPASMAQTLQLLQQQGSQAAPTRLAAAPEETKSNTPTNEQGGGDNPQFTTARELLMRVLRQKDQQQK